MAKKSSIQRQKARQHKLEKRRRKRSQAHVKTSSPGSEGTDLRTAGEWPLMECLLTNEWQKPGELVQILIARQGPKRRVATGLFLVDLGCLGVKNAHGYVSDSDREHRQLRKQMQQQQKLIRADLNLVAKIIREGIAYADKLGFKPHPDYHRAKWVLGEADPDACDESIPLGKDGKPFFISGPYDNVPQIMAKLEGAVGPDGFNYLVSLEPPPSFSD
jgi:hypothetical protein